MNERLKELAVQAGLGVIRNKGWHPLPIGSKHIERFAELVLQNYVSQIMTTEEREQFIREDEREACALLCLELVQAKASGESYEDGTIDCASAIRARGEK